MPEARRDTSARPPDMRGEAQPLSWFTPLPPARNGIADYAGMLLHEVAKLAPCTCYCEDPLAEAPTGIEVRDPAQAFRHLATGDSILHQIGNNKGHVFALDALRRFGGVVSLHDLSLLYVNELGTAGMSAIYGRMRAETGQMGETYARHWRDAGLKTAANYILFDMVGEILMRADKVIVHSEFARRKLTALHGGDAESKLVVIPHFAKEMRLSNSRQARHELGLDPDEIILLTSGFATRAKRFDWLIAALDRLRAEGRAFRWIHAGEERASEYALGDAIRARPGLGDVSAITGYLPDDKLDAYIAAADIVLNLRFPSVGENSGTLARAFSAGRCCIVSDTAAYAEIPRDVVVHVPIFDTVGALTRALDRLIGDRALRESFGRRARRHARAHLSIESIAKSYVEVARSTAASPRKQAPAPSPLRREMEVGDDPPDLSSLIEGAANDFEVTLWFESAERLAALAMRRPVFSDALASAHVEISSVRFLGCDESGDGDRVGLRVAGRACA